MSGMALAGVLILAGGIVVVIAFIIAANLHLRREADNRRDPAPNTEAEAGSVKNVLYRGRMRIAEVRTAINYELDEMAVDWGGLMASESLANRDLESTDSQASAPHQRTQMLADMIERVETGLDSISTQGREREVEAVRRLALDTMREVAEILTRLIHDGRYSGPTGRH